MRYKVHIITIYYTDRDVFFQIIAKKIREVLGIEEPHWDRSISLKHRETLGLYLERKSKTGTDANALTFEDFMHELEKEERFKMKTAKQPSFLK